MARAVDRIMEAVAGGELIAVHGDFDVDGPTGIALLTEVLGPSILGGRVVSYLPHRAREGYGLNQEAIRRLAEAGVGLLITTVGSAPTGRSRWRTSWGSMSSSRTITE